MNIIKYIQTIAILILLSFVLPGTSGVAVAKQPQTEKVRLTANDPAAGAEFGRSVAIEGDLVAVGAGAAVAGSTDKAGAVYLFKRHGHRYVREAKLVAPDASSDAEFGRSVAIQGDRVIVGARFAEVENFTKAGAAYVFRKHKGSWRYEAKITSPTPADEDNFGRALAIQGNLLVVTARKENLNADDVGAAYIFLHKGNQWIFSEKLTAGDPLPGAYFGQSVAMQGNLLAIGARNADSAGAVYLFHRTGKGWKEFAKVNPPDGIEDDQFGFSVALVGNVLTVGARRANPDGVEDAGAAYVYAIHRDSVDLMARLTASDSAAGDQFGQSVAMAGGVIAVGANRAKIGANKKQGAVYLFSREDHSWIEGKKVTADDGLAGDEFGYSLSAFGNEFVTGAHFADSTAGAAYVIPLRH
ncbi:FG-GAP repeat-containing protein [Syntrophus gentianae]|uniref:FG-GAP repeat-containing protein n=1 Tax=Syntrophus gentianae TaxID=43775 RepID=A0A1H8AW42_9BACT|nr:FG-GAP repeat protein [Syntrophus gentianae]SEM73727.1 FG-GAP repeat-containing protein [Syntrophus gentianae]